MNFETITGESYLAMVRHGAARLYSRRKLINDLNVFPIPDGDTGDNMYMTISAGCENAKPGVLSETSASISQGMLLGARGNSGVILSRIFAGISKGLSGLDEADRQQFASALQSGVDEAYKAVSTPVEGTILTVIRESVANACGDSIAEYFSSLVREMHLSLDRTPELLDVLKEACVVDSGGAGMLCIAEGMLDALSGAPVADTAPGEPSASAPKYKLDDFGPDTVLEFGYCTEFLLRLQNSKVGDALSFDETEIRTWLESVGESVVCFKDGSIVKVHVHTFDPGAVLSHARKWGEFLTVKVENMTLQHSEVTIQDNFSKSSDMQEDEFRTAPKAYGSVAVASGAGLAKSFKEAGVDVVIEGGQTMNPSARSFLDAFAKVHAQTVFVFPNNSNIIMTANQAAGMCESGQHIVVFPTKDIGAGYVAAASLDTSSKDTDAIVSATESLISSVSTCHVSKAIRDSVLDGISTKAGDWIGIAGGSILVASENRMKVAEELLEKSAVADHEVAIVFYGADVPAAEAEDFVGSVRTKYPRTEFMTVDGGQPVFDYIIALC